LGGTTGSLGVSTEPVLFNINGSASVAPIICYESIYGELVGSFFDKRNSFIAVITNDAWWLDTPGYKQHFSYGRLRAIESRKTVVRSANTGVSGVINAKGEVLQHTNFYERTAVKAQIALNNTQTYYSKAGDYLGRLSLFMVALILLVLISRSMRKK
jgi:apolipoprotein N-acyltransferase